jgi:hypothetical protein
MTHLPRICVSDNHRFLVTEIGEPFFWLGDTAWELFHRLTREEAELYFKNRQERRFNVIQAVALAELDGLNTPNRYGERPLIDNDPTRPNDAYFAYVDDLIQMAAAYDLYIGLLPTWGDKVTIAWGKGPVVFDAENARTYGQFLGARYRDQSNVIWILGGDRPPIRDDHDYTPIWRALAAGLGEGEGHSSFKTYHTMGGGSTSRWLHDEDWLDMNMMQSGHGGGRDVPVWDWITHDYELEPTKPTLDGEINYEDHPVNPWPKWDPANGYFRDHDVRKQAYRSVFAGACGVTYGHHFIWQMWDEIHGPIMNNGNEFMPWHEAITRPGGAQMQYLRALMQSRPYLTRIPDQSLLVSDPGEGGEHIRATRDSDGRYAFIYLPTTRPVTVRLDAIAGDTVQAWWLNPRTGDALGIGEFPANGEQTFTPPAEGPDWVLVLDDAA